MRSWFLALVVVAAWCGTAVAQEDKKTDDDKPADPDTGESTLEEKTLGLLPNPLQKYGIKFAATYIGETLGNVSGGIKRGAVYEGRLNLAVDRQINHQSTSARRIGENTLRGVAVLELWSSPNVIPGC